MVIKTVPLLRRVVLVLFFALKWFWPIFLVTNLPFLVTLMRFKYDLFVFILFVSFVPISVLALLFCTFYQSCQALGASLRFLGYFETFRNKLENSFHSFLQELFVHVFGPPRQEQV